MVGSRSTLAIAAIALLTLASCQGDAEPVANAAQTEKSANTAMLDNQAISIPDTSNQVTLHQGTGEFEIAPGSSSKGRVTLLENTQATWASPDRNDLITAMAINSDGSGTFSHIAVYSKKDATVELKDSAFLGDRVKITHVGIGELVHDKDADYRITIQMLEHADGEPMTSEPSIPSTRIFYVTNGKLEAITPSKDDT